MEKLTVTEPESDVTVDIDIDRLHREICRQGITGGDAEDVPNFYLAALAIGTRDEYDINETLMEFIRNSEELDVSKDAADRIEDLLR